MIPRALPKLAADAVRGHWDMSIEHKTDSPEIVAQFGHGMALVVLVWDSRTGHLLRSTINGSPTPYTQCVRLIRTKEPR